MLWWVYYAHQINSVSFDHLKPFLELGYSENLAEYIKGSLLGMLLSTTQFENIKFTCILLSGFCFGYESTSCTLHQNI